MGRRPARSARHGSTWIAALLVTTIAAHAEAQRAVPAHDTHPIDLTLWIDNDNLVLGAWSAITSIEQDGNDFGRTHATGIGVGWDVVPDRVSLRLDASTQLYLSPLVAVPVYDFATIPTLFHELERFRLGGAWTTFGAPWHASAGVALEISNRSDITFGATGQQQLWHHAARAAGNRILWQYVYTSDGTPVRASVAFDGSVGATHVEALTPWLALRFRSDAGMRLSTWLAASSVDFEVEAAILLGDRDDLRCEIVLRERSDLWLDDGGTSFHTTAELAAESAILRLWLAVHWWNGDSRTAYWIYAFPNETMSFGATVRFP